MKVSNMIGNSGKPIPNQFLITEEGRGALGNFIIRKTFQSYKSIIAIITIWEDTTRVELDSEKPEFFWTVVIAIIVASVLMWGLV